MGSGQSARKLTINNEEELDVIKVSNAVVQRLAQGAKEGGSETVKEVRPAVVAQPPAIPPAAKVRPSSPPQSGEMSPSSGYPVYYYPELTLTALEIQQQKEQELQRQDQYWQKRIQNLENNQSRINRLIDEEYRKAADEMYTNGKKAVHSQDTVQPCLECTEKVLKCYQEYPKQILQCSNLVEAFSKCVDQRRANVIAARC